MAIWGKYTPGRGKNKCKDPQGKVSQSVCGSAQEAHVMEQKEVGERAVGDEVLIGSVSIS